MACEEILQTVRGFCAREGLLEGRRRIALAISGGADSMALLCLMRLYRQQGMREQAVRIAHCLLRLPVKQDSSLVREAREEARSCILE